MTTRLGRIYRCDVTIVLCCGSVGMARDSRNPPNCVQQELNSFLLLLIFSAFFLFKPLPFFFLAAGRSSRTFAATVMELRNRFVTGSDFLSSSHDQSDEMIETN